MSETRLCSASDISRPDVIAHDAAGFAAPGLSLKVGHPTPFLGGPEGTDQKGRVLPLSGGAKGLTLAVGQSKALLSGSEDTDQNGKDVSHVVPRA